MTVNEVVKTVITELEKIPVPVSEMRSIGMPVAAAVANLRECTAVMDKAEEEARAKAEEVKNDDKPSDV